MGIFQSTETGKVGGMGRLREDSRLYRLVDMHGGGDLIPWMRYAQRSGDHSIVDSYIDVKVRDFCYNQGKGKLVTVTELVKLRNKERNAMLGAFSRKKGKGKSGPNVLEEFNQEGENVGDLKKALKLLDGGGKGNKGESKYREIAWKLDDRGSMGETLVGVCLLNGSGIHTKLAIKLMDEFPKLLNDINISEDYYGLSPLHQAIINQDVPLVALLLKRGADVNQRCYGAYFCADDQKGSRTDSLEHEYVELPVGSTNYTGTMYFGEFPLSFAACMNHPDCVRLLHAYKANINAQDTNGNTVLHMCVIHENLDMLRLAIELGASLRIQNKQHLTALTLAAKLAKKRMFTELLEYEAFTYWEYSKASNCAYPLARLDTVNEENGDLDDTSALSLVVYGSTEAHLEMLEGVLEEILEEKWDKFAKMEWIKGLCLFSLYYLCLFTAFMQRPFSMVTELETRGAIDGDGNINGNITDYDDTSARCHLQEYHTLPVNQGWVRMGCEAAVFGLIIFQILLDVKDVRRIGWQKWVNIYKAFPAKVLYKISWVLIIATVPLRALCRVDRNFFIIENYIACYAVVISTIHFLFFCRAIKFIGPFVLMIYTIIATDLKRFIMIYIIFLAGFSQSFYILFYSCEVASKLPENLKAGTDIWENIMDTPWESLIRTFIMTVGEFMTLYKQLETCPHKPTAILGKGVFLFFELCVSILQLNLLIAMMTRTYEAISNTTDEYKRQWAKVVLMLEVSLTPPQRLRYMYQYSIPTGTNKARRSFAITKKIDPRKMTDHEKEKIDKNEKDIAQQKKTLLRKKIADLEIKAGLRPVTRARTVGDSMDIGRKDKDFLFPQTIIT
ncbi:ocr-2 [Pristionchus pacificus]|uniref:Ocr-2 n=1 Tax=Pristionchus pacificus TaxID=54126 RepID=A0A2A6D0E7_PRIPA|nr:ocr-2 [Pristionchus pacificus]|eukprot:PDM83952.1 ocr-2 [Pristionchus pacificus]